MELYEAMTTTPTTRAFLPDPVDDALLYRVFDRARFAPNGGNRQGHHVIVVRDPATRRALRDLYQEPWRAYLSVRQPGPGPEPGSRRARYMDLVNNRFVARMDEIPVHLLVCARLQALQIADAGLDRPSIVGGASIYPFIQNIVLACRAEGLGTALTTLVIARERELRPLLRLPDDYVLAAHVLVGWPEPEHRLTRLTRRPVEAFATHDTFDGAPLAPA